MKRTPKRLALTRTHVVVLVPPEKLAEVVGAGHGPRNLPPCGENSCKPSRVCTDLGV